MTDTELIAKLRQVRAGVQYNNLNELEAAHASSIVDGAADRLEALVAALATWHAECDKEMNR